MSLKLLLFIFFFTFSKFTYLRSKETESSHLLALSLNLSKNPVLWPKPGAWNNPSSPLREQRGDSWSHPHCLSESAGAASRS